jgi:hypothetical protein
MARRVAVAILGLLSSIYLEIGDAAARGRYSNFGPWSNDQTQALPSYIGDVASQRPRACGDVIAAGHYLSTSMSVGGRQFISVDFGGFGCSNRAAVCNAEGCLHEVYVESRSRHQRVFSAYARDVTMRSDGGVLTIEVSGGRSNRTYRWNGMMFVPVRKSAR